MTTSVPQITPTRDTCVPEAANQDRGHTVEPVCGECNETNRAGTEFCVFCGHFLAWGSDRAPEPSRDVRSQPPRDAPPGAPSWQPPTRAVPVSASPAETAELVPRSSPTSMPAATEVGPVATSAVSCPRCGRGNDARRFCATCGHQLVSAPGRPRQQTAERSAWRKWWSQVWDTRDRSARQAYRRSLPPIYRWRRVLAGLLALALVAAGAVLVRRSGDDPVSATVDRWYELRNRNRFVTVSDLDASFDPASAGQDPARLIDNSRDAWTAPWTGTEGEECRPPDGVPVIVLTFPATRIRRMDFYAGLSEKLSDRPDQFRPRRLGYQFDTEPCRTVDLDPAAYAVLDLDVDSGRPVTSMRIAVVSAYPPAGNTPQQLLSVADISLEAHPHRVF